jgi:MFS family permease
VLSLPPTALPLIFVIGEGRVNPPSEPLPTIKKPGVHYAYIIVALGVLNVLGAQGFLRFGYAMILPGMREAMGLTFAQTGMLATANYVGYTISALAVGWLVVRFSYRSVIGAGALTVGLAMILTGTVRSYELAVVLQFIAGAAGVLAISPSMAMVAAWFAPQMRGKAAGAVSSGGPLGSLITGPLVPAMFIAFGVVAWRYSWFALGGAVVVIGLLSLVFLRNSPREVGLEPVGEWCSHPLHVAQARIGVTFTPRRWSGFWHCSPSPPRWALSASTLSSPPTLPRNARWVGRPPGLFGHYRGQWAWSAAFSGAASPTGPAARAPWSARFLFRPFASVCSRSEAG